MRFILSVHGFVDDEIEATTIRTAIDTALVPFAELDLKVESRVVEEIPVPSPE